MATITRVSGIEFALDRDLVERAAAALDPEPLREHYVVIEGRRFPPKQVLAAVTHLDRADFTTHQARAILKRLGFGAHRVGDVASPGPEASPGPHGGREAAALEPFRGRWIAQDGVEVLYDGDSPEDVIRWLRRHGKGARVWQVPADARETGSTLSTP